MKEKVTLVEGILREGIPNAKHTSQESGTIYGFRIDTVNRVSWLYLDRKFLADNSAESIINLFNDYGVVDDLQDENQPQKLFFNGIQLGEYQQ